MPLRAPETTISIVSFCAGIPALVLLGREAAWVAWRHLAPALPHRLPSAPGGRTVWAAAAATLVLLAGVAAAVLGDAAHGTDLAVNQIFDDVRVPFLIRFCLFVTDMGSGGAILAVTLVASLMLWIGGRAALVPPLLVCAIAAKATAWGAKYLFDLPRPAFVTEATAVSPTFPSDHAAGAMALYGFIAWAVVRTLDRPRARFEVGWWAALLILAIGFSRLFLGVHYLSDVLAGFLIGAFWLLVGTAVATRRAS